MHLLYCSPFNSWTHFKSQNMRKCSGWGLVWEQQWPKDASSYISQLWKSLWRCFWIVGLLCSWSSCTVDYCLVMNAWDLVRTRGLSQERVSLCEWACLSHWHWCQKLLGSHPSWDKWSFGLGGYGTGPSFDVVACKDCRWWHEGLSAEFHPDELYNICEVNMFFFFCYNCLVTGKAAIVSFSTFYLFPCTSRHNIYFLCHFLIQRTKVWLIDNELIINWWIDNELSFFISLFNSLSWLILSHVCQYLGPHIQ